MLAARFRWMVALAAAVLGVETAYAAGTATVRGAEAVNVRRAPSADSPAFVSLPRGRSVTVERVADGWAVVTLPSGQQGYIKAVFLDLPAGIENVAGPAATGVPAPAAAAATAAIVPTAAPATPDAHADRQRAELLEREVAEMRERLAAIESAVATPGSGRPTPGEGAHFVEGQRRSDEPTHVAGALFPTAATAPDPGEIGPSFALAGVGALIGFLFGTVYGRRQERNRRSRVRF
jgi:hypothetical protein